MSTSKQTRMVAVDGTDALAYVIVRPNPGNPTNPIAVEAAASGLSQTAAAYVLRHVADQFDPAELAAELAAEELLYAVGLRRRPCNPRQRLAPHGTTAAYKRHLRHGDKPCPPCRAANTADKGPRRAHPDRPHKPIDHGTPAGYKAHVYRGEKPKEDCPPCYEAHLADNRTRHAAKRRAARTGR